MATRSAKGAKPPPPTAEQALEEIRARADAAGKNNDPEYQRFLQCPEKRKASTILGYAAERLAAKRVSSAFRAATWTPLPAPSGLLPPPS